MHRKVHVTVVPLVAAVAALAVGGNAAADSQHARAHPAKSLTTINVAAVGDNINDLPIWVAQARGYYARHGLRVNLTVLAGSALGAALESGSVQFLEDSTASFLAGVAQGQSLLAVEPIASGFPVGLIVSSTYAAAHHITPTTPAGIIAKALVGSTGGSSAAATTGQAGLFLNEFGVQLSQLRIATLSSPTADQGALESNQIDWFLTSEPIPLEVQRQGYGLVVGTPSNVSAWRPRQTGITEAVVTSTAYAKAHPGS